MRLHIGRWALFAALVLLVQVGMASGYDGGSSDQFYWEGSVDSGQTLEIKAVNGSIVAEASSGSEIEVEAVKKGKEKHFDDVRVEVIEHTGGVTLCAQYRDRGGEFHGCRRGAGGNMGSGKDVSVNFKVRVPSGVHLVGRTVNGSVKARGLDGRVDAWTVNGSIEIHTDGAAEAGTVNGSIDVSMGASSWRDSLSFETINGSISVTMPSDTSADVSAKTTNGSIKTDFPLHVNKQKWMPGQSISDTLGSGGRELSLETINGSIRIKSR